MLDEGQFSVEADKGLSVIITSGQTKEDRQTLAEHAERLAADKTRGFLSAEVIKQPVTGDIEEIIVDSDVASIAFLGDGTFGSFSTFRNGTLADSISWYNLARMAEHLKQGVVELRTCSAIHSPDKETRVSLSAFIVADQTKIIGTVDQVFANHHGFEEFNCWLGPVYENPDNTAEQLRRPIGYDFLS